MPRAMGFKLAAQVIIWRIRRASGMQNNSMGLRKHCGERTAPVSPPRTSTHDPPK
jgi:hypothetical protein